MMRAHTAAEVVAAELPMLAAGEPLMARAALAVELAAVRLLRQRRGRVAGSRVLVLVGSGSNGGDGLYAAAGLARRGAAVAVLLLGRSPHPGGLAAVRAGSARILAHSGEDGAADGAAVVSALAHLGRSDLVIDAVAGIGVRGALRGRPGAVVAALAEAIPTVVAPPLVLAVDVPSGIGVDDGALPGPVLPADRTVTMGAVKPGLLLPPAAAAAGEIELVDLGLLLPRRPAAVRLGAADVADLWPVPGPADHKYRRGVLGVVAGSDAYPGAAVLATAAAAPLAGLVRYDGPAGAAAHVLAHRPEVVLGPGRVQAWLLGSGIGADDVARLTRVRQVLAEVLTAAAGSDGAVPVVVDAGALTVLPERVPATVVLTPHAGELAGLLAGRGVEVEPGVAVDRAAVERDPVRWLRAAVEVTGATVLLKGSVTLVAGPDTPVHSQADGTGWLASAGAGDVLAGLLGALLSGRSAEVMARPREAATLAAAAALVHGRAARSLGGPLAALQVAQALPGVVADLLA